MQVKTIGDGTGLVTIVPNCLFSPMASGTVVLPFVSVANSNTTLPFAVAATMHSPFLTQAPNAMTYALDSLQIDFI